MNFRRNKSVKEMRTISKELFLIKFKRLTFILLLFQVSLTPLYADGLTVDTDGRVVVSGDLAVQGKIITDETYADWAVGQYYSIPPENRSTDYNFFVQDLPEDVWTTVDLSHILPADVKRVRFFIDARAQSAANARLFILARPFRSAAKGWATIGQVLLDCPNQTSNRVRIAIQSEVNVKDNKFEIKDYGGDFDVGEARITLYGFYK